MSRKVRHLCDGCRRALLVRLSGLARHLGVTESKLALLCTIRGLQEIVSGKPLPLPLRDLRVFAVSFLYDQVDPHKSCRE